MNLWKFPGGLVDQGETIEKAAIREVWEETGINADYIGILGLREQLNFRFGQGDLYFTCLMQAKDAQINKCDVELFDAQWIPIVIFEISKLSIIQNELKDKDFYAMAGEVAKHLQDVYTN